MAQSVIHPLIRLPFVVPTTDNMTVPRGGQLENHTVLVGDHIEDSLLLVPAPEPLSPGPQYDTLLIRCGITEKIFPDKEIDGRT